MSDKPYDQQKIDKAVAMFEGQGLSAPEALLASARLLTVALEKFKAQASAFRNEIGEEKIREFATEELNEVIYDIQDSIPVAVRIFNSLMRDPDQKSEEPG